MSRGRPIRLLRRSPRLTGALELEAGDLSISRHTLVRDGSAGDEHRLDLIIRAGRELELRVTVDDVDELIAGLERGRVWLANPDAPDVG